MVDYRQKYTVIENGTILTPDKEIKDANISLAVFQISAIGVFLSGLLLLIIKPNKDDVGTSE